MFKRVLTGVFIVVLGWAVFQAWGGDLKGAVALLVIGALIQFFGRLR